MVPGQTNRMYLTPGETGQFQGKCAELCGEFHSEMLFNVEILEEDEFLNQIRELPEGLSGAELNRNPNENPGGQQDRSEEHTSELQSRGHLVCRLLLEKKNQAKNNKTNKATRRST